MVRNEQTGSPSGIFFRFAGAPQGWAIGTPARQPMFASVRRGACGLLAAVPAPMLRCGWTPADAVGCRTRQRAVGLRAPLNP